MKQCLKKYDSHLSEVVCVCEREREREREREGWWETDKELPARYTAF